MVYREIQASSKGKEIYSFLEVAYISADTVLACMCGEGYPIAFYLTSDLGSLALYFCAYPNHEW